LQNLILRDPVIFAVTAGFILDLIFGDPHSMIHPVQIIGRIISFCENLYRKIFGKKERTAGVFCALTVLFISTAVPCLLLWLCGRISFYLELALQIWWCGRLLAARSLRDETMKVYRAVRSGDLEKSRKAVSMIVGRDTERLDLTGVTKAAVETAAENTSDGEAAPLFYMMLFGAAGGFFYKAVNTMDSMIGYRNERYLRFGTFAAKLDDVLNFLPARLSGILMCAAAGLCGLDSKNALRIFIRDRKKHDSPNSAHTEAATAGALDVQLAGDAWYFGKLHKKPYLGDPIRPVEPEDIPRADRLMLTTSVLVLILLAVIRLGAERILHVL
jgi:adenosylcobinamide-phosphate synthase